ncbi:glycosyltransferase family 4 protein [soil metagenome]
MSTPLHVLIATDSFPPACGGSGWSTYELARGLRAGGHRVTVVQPRPGAPRGVCARDYEGFTVLEFGAPAPPLPYVRNYFKNERLHAALADFLEQLARRERPDLIHGQHVLTGLPAIEAARRTAVPSVCTVRDYWPVCYWSDLIHTSDPEGPLCPECSSGMMTECIRPRAGAAWPLALPMIPYMRGNLRRKREGLAAAGAIVAVSSTIAADLRARAPEISSTRLEVIPNPVDVTGLRARAGASAPPMTGPYALYLGKLAPNKGTSLLVPSVEQAELDWPLVIAGDGPERPEIQSAAQRSNRDVRMIGWVDQDAAVAWMAHASMLLFPSRGPESLSRILIEASVLGIPIAAMNTGGTGDIVIDGRTGLLSLTAAEFTRDIRRLRGDADLRQRLGGAARSHAAAHFDAGAVVARIEHLYRDLLNARDAGSASGPRA